MAMPIIVIVSTAVLCAMTAGCGSAGRMQAGLVNASSPSRFTRTDAEKPHDPLANGGESCSRNASAATPLRGRLPPCPKLAPPAAATPLVERSYGVFAEPSPAPWLPASMPMDACVGSSVEPWALPTSADAMRAMCDRACAPSLLRCVTGRGHHL